MSGSFQNNWVCALCLKEKTLCRSHIIPEFHYKPLYDRTHRFWQLKSADGSEVLHQKGIREYLLCQSCESHFSKWETYARDVIFGSETQKLDGQENLIHLGGVSYEKFKLYLLSLIWRMGVSDLPAFDQVNLGKYEELLRQHLVHSDPGPEEAYPCVMSFVLFESSFRPDWMLMPNRIRVDKMHCYRCLVGGILYSFFISENTGNHASKKAAINQNGEFLMPVEDASNIRYLKTALQEFSRRLMLDS